MSCTPLNGVNNYNSCKTLAQELNIARLLFIRKDFWVTLAASSANIVFDSGTEDEIKNAALATQIALQAAAPANESKILWTGVVSNFVIADPTITARKLGDILPEEDVVTNREITFDDFIAYTTSETVAGSISAAAYQDDIFTNEIPATAEMAQHLHASAIRKNSNYMVCLVSKEGYIYPIRNKANDPIVLSVTNHVKNPDLGGTKVSAYAYKIKGAPTSGDWVTENIIPWTDLNALTVAGTNDAYLKFLHQN